MTAWTGRVALVQEAEDPHGTSVAQSGWPWAPLLVAVALRLLLVVFIQLYHGSFLFLDDRGYDRVGAKLASSWHQGSFPDPSSVSFAGSLTYGYFVWVGALYYGFGSNWLIVKLAGAVLSGLAVLPARSIGDQLGGERLARGAAWLVALYPSGVFWGATGLKDGPLATLFLMVVALGLKPLGSRRLAAQIALCGLAFTMRPLLGVIGVLTLVVPVAQGVRTRRPPVFRRQSRRLFALAGLAALLYLVLPGVVRNLSLLGLATSSEMPGVVHESSAFVGSGPSLSAPVVALMGPFPWAFDERSRSVYQALYPGMVIWITLLPAAGMGVWEMLRRGSSAARGVVVATLTFFLMYLAYFGDAGFFRQRIALELFLLILALLAFQVRTGQAIALTAVWVVLLGPIILVQTGVLPPAAAATIIVIAVLMIGPAGRLRWRYR